MPGGFLRIAACSGGADRLGPGHDEGSIGRFRARIENAIPMVMGSPMPRSWNSAPII